MECLWRFGSLAWRSTGGRLTAPLALIQTPVSQFILRHGSRSSLMKRPRLCFCLMPPKHDSRQAGLRTLTNRSMNSTGSFVFVGGFIRSELFPDGIEPGQRRELGTPKDKYRSGSAGCRGRTGKQSQSPAMSTSGAPSCSYRSTGRGLYSRADCRSSAAREQLRRIGTGIG